MAPNIDWDVVGSVAKGNSQMDEETLQRVMDDFRNVTEADFRDDHAKLFLLFKSSINIYDIQQQEFENLIEEQVNSVTEKEAEVEELRRKLEEEKRYGGGPIHGDTEYLRAENRNLSELLEGYKEQEAELKLELEEATRDRLTFERENEEMKRLNKELKSENQEMRADLRDYRQIMETQQREKLDVKGHVDSEMREKLLEKNSQISDLLTQMTQLEKLNKELEENNRGVRMEIETAQQDMERMADEYEKMKRVIDGTDHFSENLQKNNSAYKLQLADLRSQLKAKQDELDAVMETVNTKVDEWRAKLAQKDKSLLENAKTITMLQERIASAALDQDRIKAERLTKQLKEKEEQIKQLQTSLEQVIADLDAQTAIVQDLRRESGANREIISYRNQIKTLQAKITDMEDEVKDAESHRKAAEEEALMKDRRMNDAYKRIDDIESGEYGLSEAVHEIKECRNQIKVRDQNIEELTRQVSQAEEKLNDILDENDEYRERLGINPRDLMDIAKMRKSRALRQQQFRAENQILLKEIERLEEERIEMKKQIRSQAQTYSQRAMSEGLHQDDIELIEDYIAELKRKRKIGKPAQPSQRGISTLQQMNWRVDELNRQADKTETDLQTAQVEKNRLQQERKSLLNENEELKRAMKEILEALKKSQEEGTVSGTLEIPSLERLLNAIEVKHIHGEYDPALHLKAQVDQLTGRNDELRRELRLTRADLAAACGEKANLKTQNDALRSEVATLSKLAEGKGGRTVINTIPMPKNIDPAAADIITALNEQLMQVMDDVNKRDVNLNKVTESLERSRRQFHVLRHQNHLVYKEHLEEKKKWEEVMKKKEEEKNRMIEHIEKDKVRVQELDRLLDSLERDPDTVKQRLAETTRKISLLRVNEKSLIRHHKALQFSEEQLHRENARLRNEILQMEKAVSERIGYLERYKDMAAYKIATLQRILDTSVAESELVTANRKFDELTVKYRNLLQKENQFVAKNTKVDTLQTEVKLLNEDLQSLRQELGIEKEKRHTLEEALQRTEGTSNLNLSRSGSKDAINYEISSVMKKVTVLEMKELNERQRADHSSRMYNQIKSTVDVLENRNTELEQKFAELTKLNLNSQKVERELRDELAAAVPLSVSEADRKKIGILEEEAAKKKVRMSQLQDMADIAQNQLRTMQSQQQGREREMKSLRQQVREFQVQSDDKSLLGKLHRQILTLQSSEADMKLKLDKTTNQVKKLEAHVLKQEKLIDEKELMIYHVRTETTNRNRQLKKTIQSLRQRFSGALPLNQQERFSQALIRLQEDKITTQEELKRVRREREKLEDKLAEADIKREGLEELKKTIKDGRGAQKLEEWCAKMDALRLQDMKLQRQVVRQNEEMKYLEKINGQHDRTIAGLEEDIVQMLKAQEKQQLEWEQRETEMERMLDRFTIQQREVSKKAKRLQDVSALIPDPNLPLDVQLRESLETIAKQTSAIKDLQGQVKFNERDNDRLKDKQHALEGDVMSRDRIINELRMRIPQTSTATVVKAVKTDLGMDTETNQQLRVAMETIETLKKRLQQKEDSLTRYKQLLEESRREHEELIKVHERQLTGMHKKIHSKTDDAFNKFKRVAMDAMAQKPSTAPTATQLSRMSELEEMVREQDNAMATLMDRIRASNADVVKQKQLIAETRRHAEKERSRILDEHDHLMKKFKDQISAKERSIDEVEKELALTKADLANQKELTTHAPTAALKNLVSRLKTQLEEKEVQQQKLSHALTELRADLVQQAQENVRAAAEGSNTGEAVQVLVQKKTAFYKDEIEDLKNKIASMQRGLKQEKQKQDNLKSELKNILEESEKKEQAIGRLKLDKQKLDQENERLRDKIRRLAKADDKQAPTDSVSIKFTDSGAVMSVPPPKPSEDSRSEDSGSEKPVVEEDIIPEESSQTDAPLFTRPHSSRLPKATTKVKSGVGIDRKEEDKNERVQQLEEEMKKLQMDLEKASAPGKNTVEVAKWEAKKQWQGRVDNLRNKLQEKEKQIQLYEKQVSSLRETVSRLERDKLRRVGGGGAPIHAVGQGSELAVAEQIARKERHNVEDLSRRLHELAEENSRLRKESTLPRNVIVAEMEAKNRSLREKLEALEKEMLTAGLRQDRNYSMEQLHREREDKFQSDLLKLYAENAELRFEIEQNKIDIPRLKDRIEDQQRYIELLRAEKREAETKVDKMKVNQHRRGGMHGGTSGKSVQDLEKTVALMKKVVERVQRENESLKKAPGVVSNDMLEKVKKENVDLKQRIESFSKQIGGQLSYRYESKTLGVERLMKENERLRKDLEKGNSVQEKLRVSKNALQVTCDKMKNEKEKLEERLRVAESKAPRLAGAGSKGYNSVVTGKLLESKLQKCEEELQERSSQVTDLKNLLQENTAKEKQLLKEIEKLKEQVELLENFPPGTEGSDVDVVRELQQARLSVAELKKDTKRQEEMLKVLRRHLVTTGQDTEPMLGNDMLSKLQEYDSTLERNAKLNTELALANQERERLKDDVKRLEKELSNFNDDFFDEIEDLKYNYAEAVKRNVLYEEQLRNVSEQFGVSVNIPDPNST